MGTTSFPCGCTITRSMFGEREIVTVLNCLEHAFDLQNELQAMVKKILNIQENILMGVNGNN